MTVSLLFALITVSGCERGPATWPIRTVLSCSVCCHVNCVLCDSVRIRYIPSRRLTATSVDHLRRPTAAEIAVVTLYQDRYNGGPKMSLGIHVCPHDSILSCRNYRWLCYQLDGIGSRQLSHAQRCRLTRE